MGTRSFSGSLVSLTSNGSSISIWKSIRCSLRLVLGFQKPQNGWNKLLLKVTYLTKILWQGYSFPHTAIFGQSKANLRGIAFMSRKWQSEQKRNRITSKPVGQRIKKARPLSTIRKLGKMQRPDLSREGSGVVLFPERSCNNFYIKRFF